MWIRGGRRPAGDEERSLRITDARIVHERCGVLRRVAPPPGLGSRPPTPATSVQDRTEDLLAIADYPAAMTPEVEQLRTKLDGLRNGVVKKLAGLSPEDARRSTVGSGTNLAGLVQHLTFVESKWFEEIVGGGKAGRGHRSMLVDPSESLQKLRSEYRAACEESNEIIASVGDGDAPVIHNGKRRNLRWVLLSVIEETARHAGHADIIREQIDGQTGR